MELAHYYPGWIWDRRAVARMKSLLLFFDGYLLLLPDHHFNATVENEGELALPLLEAGLIYNLDPYTWLTEEKARRIRLAAEQAHAGAPGTGLTQGPPRVISASGDTTITGDHFISRVEVGTHAEVIMRAMIDSGLVTRLRPDLGPDMVETPGHVRSAILRALGLAAARDSSSAHQIHLVGDLGSIERRNPGVANTAGWAWGSSVGEVVHRDMLNVGIDLSEVPLDEVLDFRREHGKEYRKYARGLRKFVAAMEAVDAAQQERLLRDRREEIADAASDLRSARRAWGRPMASLAIAGAGALWTLRQADPIGSVIGIISAAAGFTSPEHPQSDFTYLFEWPND